MKTIWLSILILICVTFSAWAGYGIYSGDSTATNFIAGTLRVATSFQIGTEGADTITSSTNIAQRNTVNTFASLNTFSSGIKFVNLTWSATAPTITSAGTSPSITASNGTAAFIVDVGTGGTAHTIVLAMPTAANGWICHANNITAAAANRADTITKQTASTTTSVTLQNQSATLGTALAFAASDLVRCQCTAY